MENSFFWVSVKGLYFQDKKLLMMQEDNGIWELPGGRIQGEEDLVEALRREVKEEMGLECEVLENFPSIVYPTLDNTNNSRIMLFYKINLKNLNFTPSPECMKIEFFSKEEIKGLNTTKQLRRLLEYI